MLPDEGLEYPLQPPDMPMPQMMPQDKGFGNTPVSGPPRGFQAPPRMGPMPGFMPPPMMPTGGPDFGDMGMGAFEAMMNKATPREISREALGGEGYQSKPLAGVTRPEIDPLDVAGLLKELKRQVDLETSLGDPVGFDMRYTGSSGEAGDFMAREPGMSPKGFGQAPISQYDTSEPEITDKQWGVPRDEEQLAAEEGRITDKQQGFIDRQRYDIMYRYFLRAQENGWDQERTSRWFRALGYSDDEIGKFWGTGNSLPD